MKLPPPTKQQAMRNHKPVMIWSPTVLICTFGGEPVRPERPAFIYKHGREAPDRCKGWELEGTLKRFYPK